MCLIGLIYKRHPSFPVILVANRDEFYARPTLAAGLWEHAPTILGGRDLQAGGTWLGINAAGRFAAITNYREPHAIKSKAPSRGEIAGEYLSFLGKTEQYLDLIEPKADAYNGFNCLAGDVDNLYYFSNRGKNFSQKLSPGLYGLSNHLLETPWPKVIRLKSRLETWLQQYAAPDAQLFDILKDKAMAPQAILPSTGVSLEWERILSAMFIESPHYGTRLSTILAISATGWVSFWEQSYVPPTAINSFHFQI